LTRKASFFLGGGWGGRDEDEDRGGGGGIVCGRGSDWMSPWREEGEEEELDVVSEIESMELWELLLWELGILL